MNGKAKVKKICREFSSWFKEWNEVEAKKKRRRKEEITADHGLVGDGVGRRGRGREPLSLGLLFPRVRAVLEEKRWNQIGQGPSERQRRS